MTTSQKIQEALDHVRDQTTFITELLQGALGWPIPDRTESLDAIGYDWSESDLRSRGLSERIVDGTIKQILLQSNQPWGIFVLEFKHPDVFTAGRGLTGPLRSVLRGLVASRRRDAKLASFRQENLLFICTHQYQHYRFACFKAATGDIKAAPLSTFGWGPDSPARTACEFNLPELIWPKAGTADGAWINAWAAAFDVEKVTKRFYEEYKKAFENAEKLIAAATSLAKEELRLFTQTLFNRLMFLRFLERKGWLEFNGRHDYLRALHHAGPINGQSFYASRIVPLFFSALAIEGAQDQKLVGNVPFLNGGLFAESGGDKKVNDLPDAMFDPIIGSDGLFYRFNFTVEESTPLDIEAAVDPEMLGKVFEELVTGRHESGSYYTPRPIVSFMCREALKAHLGDKTKASPEALEQLVDKHEVRGLTGAHGRQIIEALDSLKAVDPACGSGAYLLGLMQELVAIYRLLYSEKLVQDTRSLYDLKLRIISHNLYGVDIDPFATNIAMLRLWLSLSVEASQALPLPNLDFKIETGDSLLGPNPMGPKDNVETGDLFIARMISIADDLVQFKDRYLKAHGGEKQRLRDVIEREETRIAKELQAIRGKGVIDWRIQFAEVFFRNKGFDVVLANPPYIDSENMTKHHLELREAIKARYVMTKGNWDIYIAFYEMGFRLLNGEGVLTFITPDKWISKPFGEELRLQTNARIFGILRAGRGVFESANVDAIVTVFKNTPQSSLRIYDYVGRAIGLRRVLQKGSLKPPYAYDWLFSDFTEVLDKISAHGGMLSVYAVCENACATSDAYRLKEFIGEETNQPERKEVLKIINTGTIGRYVSNWGKREMVYLGERYARPVVHRERFLEAFPNSYGRKSIKPKLIVKGLNLLDACLDPDGSVIPGKTTLMITSNDVGTLKLVLALTNSSLAFFYLREKYPASSYNQGTTFTKEMINGLPIPKISQSDRTRLISLVDHIIATKEASLEADTSGLEHEIDQLVYQLYDLTPEEIAIVEGKGRTSTGSRGARKQP